MTRRGFLKKGILGLLTASLLLSNTFPSFAASQSDVTPGDYVFMTVLQACGINASNVNKQWESAYRGYLEATGNTAMLNRLNSYNSLSWGSQASRINDLYQSLKGWLSQSSAYGTNARFYTLPSTASPMPSALGSTGITPSRFSDVNYPTDSGYTYLYSDAYLYTGSSNRTMYVKRNIYMPNGLNVFAIGEGFSGYMDTIWIKFYYLDSSSPSGYTALNLRSIAISYWMDTGAVNGKDANFNATWNQGSYPIRQLMNAPFKIFSNTDDAKTYAKTGIANNLFSNNKCSLWWHSEAGVNLSLQKTNALEINDTMTLPSNNADAITAYNNARGNLPLTTVTDRLKACGLTASFDLPYTVEYYQDGELKKSVTGNTTTLSPTLDTLDLETFPGYRLDDASSTTFPFTVSETDKTLRFYYQSYDLPYTIEYYQDGKLEKTISGSVSSLSPTLDTLDLETFSGYKLDPASSTAFPYTVTETNKTLKFYYQSYDLPYTVEYYQDGKQIKTISGTVSSLTPEVISVPSYLSPGFMLDGKSGTPLPFPVSEENNVIKVYYITDEKSPITVTKNSFTDIAKNIMRVFLAILPMIVSIFAVIFLTKVMLRFLRKSVKSQNK